MPPGFLVPILGATDPADILNVPVNATRNASRLHATEMLVVVAALLLLLTALVIWAVFIRKPQTERSRVRSGKSHPRIEERDDGTIRKRKKHRKQRRAHRVRNPTLSEAGGLPPPRPDGVPPPI